MTAHLRTCAHCGTGPASGPASGSCCWNPIGCGCGAVNARFDLPGSESTSALLRQTQGALAASQADLTEAERQREDLRRRLNLQSENWIEERKERDLARAELASATAELESLREHQEIRARLLRERDTKLRVIDKTLGIYMRIPRPDAVHAIRELLAELERLRAQLPTPLHTEEPPA